MLYQNDDYGKDYLKGLKDGLGDKAKTMIVAEAPYEVTDPTVDSQIVSLKASGADVFFNITTPKFAAQAIRKAADIGWKPVHFLNNVSASVGSVLKPAGLENAQGLITDVLPQGPDRSDWNDDPGCKDWLAFMDKYYPDGDAATRASLSRLRRRADHGAGAQAMRRRSHARERDEAGREPEEFQVCRSSLRASRRTPARPTTSCSSSCR